MGWRDGEIVEDAPLVAGGSWRDGVPVRAGSWQEGGVIEQAPQQPVYTEEDRRQSIVKIKKSRAMAQAYKTLGESNLPSVKAFAVQAGAPFVSGIRRLFGQEEEADQMVRFAGAIEQAQQEMEKGGVVPDFLKRGVRGAAGSLFQAAAASPGGPAGIIAAFSTQEGNRAYVEGKDAGLTGAKLARHVIAQSTIEAVPALIMQRLGLGGFEKIMGGKQAAASGLKEALKAAGKNIASELPEELITELGHSLESKFSGVDPSALDSENIKRLVFDTVTQTILAVGAASTPSVVAGRQLDKSSKNLKEAIKSAESGVAPSRKQFRDWGIPASLGRKGADRLAIVKDVAARAITAVEEAGAAAVTPAVEEEAVTEAVKPTDTPPTQPAPPPAAPPAVQTAPKFMSNREQDRVLLEGIDNGTLSVSPEFNVDALRAKVTEQGQAAQPSLTQDEQAFAQQGGEQFARQAAPPELPGQEARQLPFPEPAAPQLPETLPQAPDATEQAPVQAADTAVLVTDMQHKQQQGKTDIVAVEESLAAGKSLLVATRSLSAVRLGLVTEILTGEVPRTRAKMIEALTTHYEQPPVDAAARFTAAESQRRSEVEQFVSGGGGHLPIVVVEKALAAGGAALQKFLTSRGNLPQTIYDLRVKRDNQVSRIQREVGFAAKDFGRAVKREYGGRDLTERELIAYNGALAGQVPMESLPVRMRAPVARMRILIDTMSRRLIDSGAVQGQLAILIDKNMGIYINRSFKVFTDPKWAANVPKDIRNKAAALIRQEYPKLTDNEVNGYIDNLLYEGKAAQTPMALLAKASLGAKDLGILTRRKQIPREILALFGEHKNPLLNFANSMTKIGNLIANHQFLMEARKVGLDGGFFSKVKVTDSRGALIAPIAAKKNETLAPLNGLYTTPEILEAFQAESKHNDYPRWLRYLLIANSGVKASKTVFSLMTQVRNITGNVGFAVMNGHWRAGKMGSVTQMTLYDLFKVDNEKARAYILRAVELGLIGEDVHAGELRSFLKEATSQDLDMFIYDLDARRAHKVKAGIRKIARFTGNLYQAGDAVWKLYAWENEKARYSKAFPEMSVAEIEELTAEIIMNTYPTYSRISEAIRHLRKFPLVGTFVSFPAEVARTTYHSMMLAKKELADPRTRGIGAQRLAGIVASLTMSSGVAASMMLLFGVSRDEDDDMREFTADYQKDSTFAHFGRLTNGNFRYVDLSYSDPHTSLLKPLAAFLNGDDPLDMMFDGVMEAAAPFVGEEILLGTLKEAWDNRKGNRPVYNPQDSIDKRALAVSAHIWKAFEPGTVTSLKRVAKGLAGTTEASGKTYNPGVELAAMFAGVRIEELDIEQALPYRMGDLKKDLREADAIFRQVANSRGSVTESQMLNAYASTERARKRLFEAGSKTVQAAMRLGVSRSKVIATMREKGMTAISVAHIINGTYAPYRPTNARLKTMQRYNPKEFVGRAQIWSRAVAQEQSRTFTSGAARHQSE